MSVFSAFFSEKDSEIIFDFYYLIYKLEDSYNTINDFVEEQSRRIVERIKKRTLIIKKREERKRNERERNGKEDGAFYYMEESLNNLIKYIYI